MAITEQILSLTEDQKLGLIVALSQQVAYPRSCKPLGYHVDRLPLDLEQHIETLPGDGKKVLIKTIVNHYL